MKVYKGWISFNQVNNDVQERKSIYLKLLSVPQIVISQYIHRTH